MLAPHGQRSPSGGSRGQRSGIAIRRQGALTASPTANASSPTLRRPTGPYRRLKLAHGLLVQPVVLADPGGRQAAEPERVPERPERAPAGRRGRLRAVALAEHVPCGTLTPSRPLPPFRVHDSSSSPASVDVDILKSENPRLALAAADRRADAVPPLGAGVSRGVCGAGWV